MYDIYVFLEGELYSWGCNDNGQLGLGLKMRSVPFPNLVSSLTGLPISLVACGGSHSFILSKSGKFKTLV